MGQMIATSQAAASLSDPAPASPVTLASLLAGRQVWQWQAAPLPLAAGIATGIRALDAALPLGGWPAASLSEVLSPAPGLSELRLLWPMLARLSQAGGRVVLVAPPFVPCAIAWQRAGVLLSMPPSRPMRSGPSSSACGRAAVRPCWAGPRGPVMRRYAGCRWPPTMGRRWAWRCVPCAMPPSPRRPRCGCSCCPMAGCRC